MLSYTFNLTAIQAKAIFNIITLYGDDFIPPLFKLTPLFFGSCVIL